MIHIHTHTHKKKKRTFIIVDFAVQTDHRKNFKDSEKSGKYVENFADLF